MASDGVGADFFKDRERYFSDRANNTELTPEEATNLDLGDESIVSELEDPGLIEHMRHARARFDATEAAAKSVMSEADIRLKSAQALGKLAELIVSCEEPSSTFATAADEIHIIGEHLARMAEGHIAVAPHFDSKLPRGVCEDPAFKEMIRKTKAILQKRSAEMVAFDKFFQRLRSDLGKIRLEILKAWDDNLERSDSLKRRIAAQRELLQSAATVYKREERAEDQSREHVLGPIMRAAQAKKNASAPVTDADAATATDAATGTAAVADAVATDAAAVADAVATATDAAT
jgi:hypothetical protein